MRRPIETAPKDGTVIILEDSQTGAFELSQWSSSEDGWVNTSGQRSRFDPASWHEVQRSALQDPNDASQSQEGPTAYARAFAGADNKASRKIEGDMLRHFATQEFEYIHPAPPMKRESQSWRRLRVTIGGALILASLVGTYFRRDVTAYAERDNINIFTEEPVRSDKRTGNSSDSLGAVDTKMNTATADSRPRELESKLALEKAKNAALEVELKAMRRDLVKQAVRAAETSDDARRSANAVIELKQALSRETATTLALQDQLKKER